MNKKDQFRNDLVVILNGAHKIALDPDPEFIKIAFNELLILFVEKWGPKDE